MTFANYFARDVDANPIPLIDDAYVPVTPEQEQEPTTPPRLHICRVLEFLWNVAFASLIGAAIIYLIQCPAEALWPPVPLECALGLTIGFALCGITLALHRCAQRNAQPE